MQGAPNGLNRMGAMSMGGASQDSMKRRDKLEDSITISYRLLNQPLTYLLDSTVDDFTTRFPFFLRSYDLVLIQDCTPTILIG